MRKISDMKPGEEGIVKKVESFGSLKRRIIDMGVTPGTRVKMVKSAPLGDPMEIKIHGYDLSLRKSDADKIYIFNSESEAELIKEKNNLRKVDYKNISIPITNSYSSKKGSGFTAALIGNPNSGKTTLFNNLTGSYQYVGNWPGVTVERKEGRIKNIDSEITLVDLPGVYSLSPYSPEEIVTRNYIINETPDVLINIIDATNLERNLYLTTQLLELDVKVILVLNMTDLLSIKGKKIDLNLLERELGVPVVSISASKNKGTEWLLQTLSLEVKSNKKARQIKNIYSVEVVNALKKIENIVSPNEKYIKNSYFRNIKIFEDDSLLVYESNFTPEKANEICAIQEKVSHAYSKDKEMIIADERYLYICSICSKIVQNFKKAKKLSFSNKLDKIATGKYTAIPFFILILLSIFYITFGPFGVMLKSWCENFINMNTYNTIERILNYFGASSWSKSLVLDAIIGGVGSVISFLPQVVLLFTLLSFLEDCGYMARAAFIMDKPFRKIGLSGRSFIPLVMGFGCSVPAVLGTKILENKKDRNLTIFLIPFISCSAKMPLYLLFASAFFPKHQTLVIFLLYLFGIIVAIVTAFVFKDTLFKGEDSPFIMEIPEYKFPSARNIWLSVWDRTKDFIERAGTVILLATVVVWFLQSFDFNFSLVQDRSKSILAIIGSFIAPFFSLCGFGNWQSCVALLTGVMAKESIVSTLAVLYGSESTAVLNTLLPSHFSFASALSFLVFALLYTPCVAAISAIHKEFEDWKLTAISVIYQLLVAYIFSMLTFQVLNIF